MRLLLILTVILLPACSSVPESNLLGNPTSTLSPKIDITPAANNPVIVVTPFPTNTPPAPTSIPTLTANQAHEELFRLFTQNYDCEFPCWDGNIPGETDLATMHLFMDQFATFSVIEPTKDPNRYHDFIVPIRKGESEDLNLRFQVAYAGNSQEVLDWLSLRAGVELVIEGGFQKVYDPAFIEELLPLYTPVAILEQYGAPTDTLLFIEKGFFQFSLIFSYPEKGIIVEFLGPLETSDNQYKVCPLTSHPNIWLWEADTGTNTADILVNQEMQVYILGPAGYYLPITEATGVEIQEILTEVNKPDQEACFLTTMSLLPDS